MMPQLIVTTSFVLWDSRQVVSSQSSAWRGTLVCLVEKTLNFIAQLQTELDVQFVCYHWSQV